MTGDAETGRPSGAGLSALRAALAPAHDAVVFDLGTNDTAPLTIAAGIQEG